MVTSSQNGWVVRTSSSGLAPLSWITGRVLPGDVFTIFDFLCQKFNATVEPIRRDQSWGWAYRAVRGGSVFSNHASATAIDLNAPSHPLGRRGTFSPAQNRAIQRILNDLDGVVRWGGDYAGRPDEMHFEINASSQRVAAVADRIRKGISGGGGAAPDSGGGGASPSDPTPAPTPKPIPLPEEEDTMFRIRVAEKTDGVANVSGGTIYLCRFGNTQEAVFRALTPAQNEAVDRAGIEIRRIGTRDYSENEKNLMRAAILDLRDSWKVV